MPSNSSFPSKQIRFSIGEGRNLGKAQNQSESLTKFAQRFKEPMVTHEKLHEYQKLNDRRQAHLKGLAGWFMRARVEKGQRTRNTIQPGDILTFDVDYATPEWMEALLAGEILPGIALFAHTTRSHTPENPRVRLIVPLSTELPREKYPAASRIVGQLIDPEMQYLDKVSARIAQMMFLPTVSSDMKKHYVFYKQGGKLANWEKAITTWELKNGSATDIGGLPRFAGEGELRASVEKAEDPLTKDGIVGIFCRTYSITELVEGKNGEEPLLGEFYEVTEHNQGSATRMTYTQGTTSNGAVVYDDIFVYSHHGSDPAQDKLLNAYDLALYHLFDALSDDEEAPMKNRASIKALNKWIPEQAAYKLQMVEERYDLEEMFDDDDDHSWQEDETDADVLNDLVGDFVATETAEAAKAELDALSELMGMPIGDVVEVGPPRYERQRAGKPPKNWVATELELTEDGLIKSTLHNIATIITSDPRFFRKIAFNEFSNQVVLLADIKTKSANIPTVKCNDKERGMLWSDFYDLTLRAIIEAPNGKGKPGYGFKASDRDLVGGVKLAAHNNAFHPIREKLARHRAAGWDGVDRIKDFLHRHLGTEDSLYAAEALRMKLMASIARVETPGCKFDYAIILEGPQGIGKSTFIKLLYGEDYFGELDCDLHKRQEVAEQVAGKWAMELPELGALYKADHNHAKQFMRRQDDDVREAYGRSVTRLPRQCVFWGTTNDGKFLRDPTGNRSYWPLKCSEGLIDFAAVLRERDLIWQQAVYEYDQMRAKYPKGDLPLTLKGEALASAQVHQEKARQKEQWEVWADMIEEWAATPVTKKIADWEFGIEPDVGGPDADADEDRMVTRTALTMVAMLRLIFGEHATDKKALNSPEYVNYCKTQDELLNNRGFERLKLRVQGDQQWYYFLSNTSDVDRSRGYIFTGGAEPLALAEQQTDDSEDDNGESLI